MHNTVIWLPILSVVVVYAGRILELRTKRNTVPGSTRETVTLRLFVLAGTLMLVGSLTEYWLRGERLRLWTFVTGWGCAAASFALRRRAIAALGRFWSLHVEIRENHELVKAGPFRWVRHPTYLSMILELLCGGLMLNSWYSLLGVSLLFVPTLIARIHIEESALVSKFGEAYERYQQTTPALFPYKLPCPR
jgi:protein-S-isoprenylcysteine O-methyltransferase Ste14